MIRLFIAFILFVIYGIIKYNKNIFWSYIIFFVHGTVYVSSKNILSISLNIFCNFPFWLRSCISSDVSFIIGGLISVVTIIGLISLIVLPN